MTTYHYTCKACRHRSATFTSASTRDAAAAKHARGCHRARLTDQSGRAINSKN